MTEHESVILIGELSRRVGVSPKTIRYYESLNLLGRTLRGESGYRHYTESDVERLRFIQGAKALGLTLAQVGEILDLNAKGRSLCAEVSKRLDVKLQELDRQIEGLSRYRDELRAYKGQVDANEAAGTGSCPHVAGVTAGKFRPTAEPREDFGDGPCRAHLNTGPLRLVPPGKRGE